MYRVVEWLRLFVLAFSALELFPHLISLYDFRVCVFSICRLFDHSMEGFKNWEFMTTHCWGEKAAGDWVLEIYDSPSQLRSQKVPGKKVMTISLTDLKTKQKESQVWKTNFH